MRGDSVMNIPTYTHAIVRAIPDSYASDAVGVTEKICIDKVCISYEFYYTVKKVFVNLKKMFKDFPINYIVCVVNTDFIWIFKIICAAKNRVIY